MNTVLSSIFFFILALGILITIHEFGHYWVARKLGVKVLRFSVGFGKPLFSKRHGADDTEYVVAAIPLGGYVKMLDEREGEEIAEHELHRAFNRQKLWKRSAIVLAGPVFNFILAILAYWLIFVIGVTGMKPIVGTVKEDSLAEQAGLMQGDTIVAIEQKATPNWETAVITMLDVGMDGNGLSITVRESGSEIEVEKHLALTSVPEDLNRGGMLDFIGIRPYRPQVPPVIGKMAPGGPAEKSGIQGGDKIIAVDGRTIADWEEFVDIVRASPQKMLLLEIEREGETLSVELTPDLHETGVDKIGRVGAGVQLREMPEELKSVVQYGPLEAIGKAAVKTWDMSVLTCKMLAKMVVGDISLSNLSGPISIARYAGYSASVGFISFLTFLAIISISLGVLNLLPIPMLDGGHLMYYLAEAFTGKPVSEQAQIVGYKIGVMMLVSMMMLAFYNDIVRLF